MDANRHVLVLIDSGGALETPGVCRTQPPMIRAFRTAACLSCTVLLGGAVAAQPSPQKRILLLEETGPAGLFRARFDAAFIDGIRSSGRGQVDLYEEAIEPERPPGAEPYGLLREYLRRKYADRKIDVIVTEGSAPLAFARENRAIFGSPPIVAVATAAALSLDQNVTGLQRGAFFSEMLDVVLKLLPDTRHVIVIDGARENDGELQSEIEGQWRRHGAPAAVGLAYLRDVPLDELVSRLAAIPPRSVVLFVRQTLRDRRQDVDEVQALDRVLRASPAPVFSQIEPFVGRGIVGGTVWRFETDARRLAEVAERIASGTKAASIPQGRATYTTELDWRQLRRWQIPESRLPAGSVVLFRSPSFLPTYRAYVVGGVLLFGAQLALIAGLLVQRASRRRAEQQLRSSEARYRSVVDTQSELVCRFLPDATLTFVNDAYCRFWRKSPDELLGTRFTELIPEKNRTAVLANIGHLRSGSASHEHPVTLADGTIGWQHWINHAIGDPAGGQPLELQGVGRDITDRKRAEESLERMAERNSAILRAIPDLMFVISRDGTYLDYHARDRRLLYAPPEAFLGKNVRAIMPPDLADVLMDAIERTDRSDEPTVVEYQLDMADESRIFEARLVPSERDRILCVVRDISESKRALELNRDLAGRLIASQEDERQRIARELHDDMSQELALLNVEIDRILALPAADRLRDELRRLAGHAGEIASAMHNLSHELHPTKLQTLGLVAAVQSLCRDFVQQRRIEVEFTHDGALLQPVDADVSLCLYRITQEALHNIAKHSQAQAAWVRLTCDTKELTLLVSDSGVGFDPTGVAATGLGLVSMRERVNLAKGRLVIHAAPGQGTRIAVQIPLRPARSLSSSSTLRTA